MPTPPKAKREETNLLTLARAAYLKSRAEGEDTGWATDEAIAATTKGILAAWQEHQKYQTVRGFVGQTSLPQNIPVPDPWRVKKWRQIVSAAATTWETDFHDLQAQQSAAQAFETEVVKLQFLADQAKKLLDGAIANQASDPSTGNAQSYSICYKSWIDATERLRQYMANRVEQTTWERQRPDFEASRDKAFKMLYKEYKGKGEAYRLLCQRGAAAWATLERLEEQGILPGQPEHTKVNAEFLAIVSQIQKHTESIKTEVQETRLHEFGDKILKVVERHLQNQPLVMKRILAEIEGDVIDGEVRLLGTAS